MSFKEDMRQNEYKYFKSWMELKRILVKERKNMDDRIRSANQMAERDQGDKRFWLYILNMDLCRKSELDSIMEYMSDAEDEQ